MLESQLTTIAHADAVCAADPVQAVIRDELLNMERHATLTGMDARDIGHVLVYALITDPSMPEASVVPLNILTSLVRHFAIQFDATVVRVLGMISQVLTNPDGYDVVPDPTVRDAIATALNEWVPSHPRVRHGIGVAFVQDSLRTDAPGASDLASGQLRQHPDMRPCWTTHLVCVDSRQWTVMRQDGYGVVYGTDGPDDPDLGIAEMAALTRLLVAAGTQA